MNNKLQIIIKIYKEITYAPQKNVHKKRPFIVRGVSGIISIEIYGYFVFHVMLVDLCLGGVIAVVHNPICGPLGRSYGKRCAKRLYVGL